jgi:NAD(P)H dehydrogenase (quinone)
MITITGATGRLGRLVIAELLRRGVAPAQIVAAVRRPEKATDLAQQGIKVRHAEYAEPATLAAALAGTHTLLLISGSEVGRRFWHHRNAVDEAVAAGVSLIVYTSIPYADVTSVTSAPDHRATEDYIRASGLPFVFLRNCRYIESYTKAVACALEHGAILGAARSGRVSAAPRADYAAAAAAVLTTQGHENTVYELGGDEAFSLSELAEEVSRQIGRTVVYQDMPPEDFSRALVDYGVPEGTATLLAGADSGTAKGEMFVDSGDLRRLIGRPTTPLADAVARLTSG